jgi:hypothetical protein
MKALAAVIELSKLGYRFELAGDRLRYRYEGAGDPDLATVRPLLEAVKAHKPEVLAYLSKSAPQYPPQTCESCPSYELNPWTHYPDFGAWCHRQMQHLVVGSPACEEFQHGAVAPRQPHKQVPVPATTSPNPQERILTCADCPNFEANQGPNPRQGWGKCLKRGRGRFACATACEKALAPGPKEASNAHLKN